jgi:hypothetical protein
MKHKAREKGGESVQSKSIAVLGREILISKLTEAEGLVYSRSEESYRIFTYLVSSCSIAGCS